MKKRFKACAVQFDVKKGQIKANISTILGYLEKMVLSKVSLVVLPEMFSCSFDNENLKYHSRSFENIIEQLAFFARDNGIAIAGTLPERKKDFIYNTMVFIDRDGKLKGKYRKIHLFRLTGEDLYYTSGNKMIIVNSSLGRIGLMTCYDLRFPELARNLYLKGAQIIIVSAQWPESRKEHWKILVRARAIENQLFMIASNRTGTDDDQEFPGMSMIVDPMGNILARGGMLDDCAVADINLEKVENTRQTIPCMTDRRQDLYG